MTHPQSSPSCASLKALILAEHPGALVTVQETLKDVFYIKAVIPGAK